MSEKPKTATAADNTAEGRRVLEAAHLRLLKRHPYYLPILARLRTVFTTAIDTMAVDNGLRLYVNPDFLATGGGEGLEAKEVAKIIETGLAHETMHVIRKDWVRSKHAVGPVWNLAADMEINQDIADETIKPFVLPEWAALPGRSAEMFDLPENLPEGLLAEAYYKRLMEHAEQVAQIAQADASASQQDGPEGGNGSQRGSGSESKASPGDEEGDGAKGDSEANAGGHGDEEGEEGASAGGQGGDGDEEGDTTGGDGQADGGGDAGDTGDGDAGGGGHGHGEGSNDSCGGANGIFGQTHVMSGSCGHVACADGTISPELESAAMEQDAPPVSEIELRGALEEVVKEVENMIKSRGEVPGHLQRLVDEHRKPPTVNWKQVFAKMLHRCLQEAGRGFRHTYRRKRRNGLIDRPGDPVLPGRIGVRQKVAVVVDTSGSMSKPELGAALDEVHGIIKATGSDIALYSCDASVHGERQSIRNVKKAVLAGGGGTDMRVGIGAALDEKQAPDVVVVLTDGFTPWPDERPAGRSRFVAGIVRPEGADEGHKPQAPDWMRSVPVPVKQG